MMLRETNGAGRGSPAVSLSPGRIAALTPEPPLAGPPPAPPLARLPRPPHYGTVDAMVADLAPTEPVFCVRPAELRRLANRFATAFPGRALYAVKCNPHPFVLETLYEAGIRDFDTASIEEIALVEGLFGKAAGIYYNNPIKSRQSIREASERYGCRFYTVDHADELDKLLSEARLADELVVAVRLATRPRDARYALSTKFGAAPEDAVELLRRVHRAGLRVGLSFHVGSQCLAPEAFEAALASCGQVIRQARVPVSLLNVGGGFPAPYPGDNAAPLEQYFAAIILRQRTLNLPPGCLLFCEPGRSLVATAGSVVAQVLVRKERSIFINDGVFGNLQELRHPKERRPARIVGGPANPGPMCDFKVYGPTCDSDDVLGSTLTLPATVKEGDWVEIGMMGAYSIAFRTRFNGFSTGSLVAIGDGRG